MPSGWWVADLWSVSPVLLVSWVFWVLASIILHELAHGWTAIRLGDRTPIETGHMTWNPLVHLGVPSLVLFALLGMAFGSMPVNEHRLRGRYAPSLVAVAGPVMNVLLAGVLVLALALWTAYGTAPDPLNQNLRLFFFSGAALNVVLALFNLVPVPPLDGSRIAADIVPAYRALLDSEAGRVLMVIGLVVMFTLGGRILFDVSMDAVGTARDLLVRLLPGRP